MSATGQPVVSFEGVTFGYGQTPIVEDVTMAVQPGAYVGVIGPNGSGKTTLAKLALGLLRPQQGSVQLFGVPTERFREWRRLGYVPQRAAVLASRFPATVSDVVSQGEHRAFDPWAMFRSRRSMAVDEALRTVGMWEYRSKMIGELSGGQQQRVLIGRAIVHHPELLVLDEPTAGVDRPGQELFYQLLRRLRRERGVAILVISHDVGVMLHEANKIALIDRRLRFFSSPRDVTNEALTEVYGHDVDLIIHRHG
jgi:zinc transport system ATP-binding protein